MHQGVVLSRKRVDEAALRSWNRFTAWMGLDPSLTNVKDPVPILQMFAHLVRQGILAASGNHLRKRSVEQYLRSVGQTFACVWDKDPRLDNLGKTDFRLARQLKAYTKGDPPPTRVRPMPLGLLSCLVENFSIGSDKSQAIADLAMIAFFFMLRPGEYCSGGSDVQKSPFRIKDVQFGIGQRDIPAIKITKSQHHKLTTVSLTFTDQKIMLEGKAEAMDVLQTSRQILFNAFLIGSDIYINMVHPLQQLSVVIYTRMSGRNLLLPILRRQCVLLFERMESNLVC